MTGNTLALRLRQPGFGTVVAARTRQTLRLRLETSRIAERTARTLARLRSPRSTITTSGTSSRSPVALTGRRTLRPILAVIPCFTFTSRRRQTTRLAVHARGARLAPVHRLEPRSVAKLPRRTQVAVTLLRRCRAEAAHGTHIRRIALAPLRAEVARLALLARRLGGLVLVLARIARLRCRRAGRTLVAKRAVFPNRLRADLARLTEPPGIAVAHRRRQPRATAVLAD